MGGDFLSFCCVFFENEKEESVESDGGGKGGEGGVEVDVGCFFSSVFLFEFLFPSVFLFLFLMFLMFLFWGGLLSFCSFFWVYNLY